MGAVVEAVNVYTKRSCVCVHKLDTIITCDPYILPKPRVGGEAFPRLPEPFPHERFYALIQLDIHRKNYDSAGSRPRKSR